MTDCSVRLVVVFNHPFDANLPKLDRYYGDRFGPPTYLVPFYRGPRPDVIPVYDSSYCFQSYFTRASERLLNDGREFTHVAFVADDLLLNERLDGRSLATALRLEPLTGYVKSLTPLDRVDLSWPHLRRSVEALELADREGYVEVRQALPSVAEASERLARHGLRCGSISWRAALDRTLWAPQRHWRALRRATRQGLRQQLTYPLVKGYSDLLVVPRASLPEFAHLCGVFAAVRLFVETAAATALALASEAIRTEDEVAPWHGLELWERTEVAAFEQEHRLEVNRLFTGDSRDDLLYVHPIKLSRWRVA